MLTIFVAAGGLALGYLIIDVLLKGSTLDSIERWASAFAGLMIWVLVLMVAHMATGGEVLSHPWVIRLATLGVVILCLLWKVRRSTEPRSQPISKQAKWLVTGTILVLLAAWGSPVLHPSWMPVSADIHSHMGWTEQLLNGSAVPSATITGDVPNYYPWLYHALAAFLKSFIPGNSAFSTLGAIQVLHVAGMAVALFALGRAVVGSALGGAAAAFFGGLMGQLSFPLTTVATLFTTASVGRQEEALQAFDRLAYHRSLNLPWHSLSPPYPRDIAFLLLTTLLLFLFRSMDQGSSRTLLLSGVTLGMVGLAGGEAFLLGAAICLLVAITQLKHSWKALVLGLAVPAGALYALWAVPMLINYVRLDGFVNITRIAAVESSLWDFLVQWGVVLVPAAIGLVLTIRSRTNPSVRYPLIITLTAGACLVAATLLPVLLGTGFLSLSRSHRYWPVLYLGAALLAAIAIAKMSSNPVGRRVIGGGALVCTILALVVAITASRAVTLEASLKPDYATVQDALANGERNVLAALSQVDGQCHVAVPEDFSREVFSFTGHRLVSWVGKTRGPNSARIRWKSIYEEMPDGVERHADNKALLKGAIPSAKWEELVEKYGVDVIVTDAAHASASVFSGFESTEVTWNENRDLIMVEISACGA